MTVFLLIKIYRLFFLMIMIKDKEKSSDFTNNMEKYEKFRVQNSMCHVNVTIS